MHYTRWKRNGDPLISRRIVSVPPEVRFWPLVAVLEEDECWNFGTGDPNVYGMMTLDGKNNRMPDHRFSWQIAYGAIPEGFFVLHHCDNKRCVNPKHLFLGTAQDNAHDCVAKGRHPLLKQNRVRA